MENLQETITVKIGTEDVLININAITIGQYEDIESRKQLFSQGTYESLIRTPDTKAIFVVKSIDMKSTFLVLIPDFIKKLKISSVYELSIPQTIILVKEYKKVDEWLSAWAEQYVEATK